MSKRTRGEGMLDNGLWWLGFLGSLVPLGEGSRSADRVDYAEFEELMSACARDSG